MAMNLRSLPGGIFKVIARPIKAPPKCHRRGSAGSGDGAAKIGCHFFDLFEQGHEQFALKVVRPQRCWQTGYGRERSAVGHTRMNKPVPVLPSFQGFRGTLTAVLHCSAPFSARSQSTHGQARRGQPPCSDLVRPFRQTMSALREPPQVYEYHIVAALSRSGRSLRGALWEVCAEVIVWVPQYEFSPPRATPWLPRQR